jgi:HEAT repeat protein
LDLAHDEDHVVRAEVAACLGQCRSPESRDALLAALEDRALTVREVAQRSLDQRGEPTPGPVAGLTGEEGGRP